jgi:hypothetical protein
VLLSFLPLPLIMSSSSVASSSPCASMPDVELIDTIIPLTRLALEPMLLWRMPGVLGSEGGHRGKHNKRAEISRAYSVAAGVPPRISKHISGMQSIKVQATSTIQDTLTTSTTVPGYDAQYFSLAGSVSNYASYTSIFDEYRIELVEVWISSSVSQQTAFTTTMGMWSSAIDYDDANTPASVSTVSDKQNSITTNMFEAHYHRFEPKFAVGTYSGTFVSFASATGWVDCGSPNVQHYGLKLAATSTPGGSQQMNQVTRITVAFRSPGIS